MLLPASSYELGLSLFFCRTFFSSISIVTILILSVILILIVLRVWGM